MGNPTWWPYPIPPNVAFRKSLVVVAGVFVGAAIINSIYQPFKGYEEELEKGKTELLRKYKAKHEDRIRQGYQSIDK
ncbi:unnamed protein product, partial [Mesorhabditis belari]|uniref:Uncharacterized protein n=1 Tax=Mesorhabditis belari TaxID=2138241 RepID=A0AAF3ESK9_9BILA